MQALWGKQWHFKTWHEIIFGSWCTCHMPSCTAKFWRGLMSFCVLPCGTLVHPNCCCFRHFCDILDEDLEINHRQMLAVPLGSQLGERNLTGNNTRKQLATVITSFVEMEAEPQTGVNWTASEFKSEFWETRIEGISLFHLHNKASYIFFTTRQGSRLQGSQLSLD